MSDNLKLYYIDSDEPDNRNLVLELLENDAIPDISSFWNLKAYPKGGSSDGVSAAIYSDGDFRFTQELDIISGRSFTQDELDTGADVIVWNNNDFYISTGLRQRKDIGDTVSINGEDYTVIGLSGTDNYISLKNVLSSNVFDIRVSAVNFKKVPSDFEAQKFRELVETYNCTTRTQYDMAFKSFIYKAVDCIIIILGIIMCAISIISQLFDYMVKSTLYELNIYKVQGISSGSLFEILYLPLILMTIVSLIIGYALFYLSLPLQRLLNMHGKIGGVTVIVVLSILVIIILLITIPKYNKLFNKSVSWSVS